MREKHCGPQGHPEPPARLLEILTQWVWVGPETLCFKKPKAVLMMLTLKEPTPSKSFLEL